MCHVSLFSTYDMCFRLVCAGITYINNLWMIIRTSQNNLTHARDKDVLLFAIMIWVILFSLIIAPLVLVIDFGEMPRCKARED